MAVVVLVVVVVVVAGIIIAIFGWDRYRGGRPAAGGTSATPTDEVFIDPGSGKRMRVWYDAATGEREYRPE